MRYQSRPSRRRIGTASVLLAGVLGAGGAALLAAAPASAATPEAGPHTVIFKGSCGLGGLLYSAAKPSVNGADDTESITVPAGTTLTFVNEVSGPGPKPTLTVTGHDPVLLATGSYAKYRADSGPLSVSLDPKCAVGGLGYRDYKPITISVDAKATPSAPTSGDPTHGAPAPGGHSATPGAGNHSSAATGATPPGHQPAAGASPSAPAIHQPVARGAVPSAAAAPGTGSGTSGGGDDTGARAVPQQASAAQPVSDVGPSSSTSVLALIAAVCLVGVGAAAVRTVLSQRRQLGTARS